MTILFDKTSQANQSLLRWRTQVFKIEWFVCKRFLPSPPPPPLSFFGSHFISRAAKTGLSLLRNKMETLATQAIEANEITDPGRGDPFCWFVWERKLINLCQVWLPQKI